MVFEYGKRNLPIPERVPFRLTRDTVDPFLAEGVNGHFKASAVDVMEQLRNNSQVFKVVRSYCHRRTMVMKNCYFSLIGTCFLAELLFRCFWT